MFANFDYTNFPYVIVKLNETIKDDDDFNYFLNKWSELYENKKDYIFVFDTTNVGFPPIKYCFKLSIFIKTLRQQQKQYLKKSYIIVKSNTVRYLLDLIFKLQPPIADVKIVDNDLDETINFLKSDKSEKLNVITEIKSKKPFFSFL